LAVVLDGFKQSPHGFIVRTIKVEPASAAVAGEPASAGGTAPVPPAGTSAPAPPVSSAPGARAVPGRGVAPIVINEKLLKVSLLVEVVKLSPPPTDRP